MIQNVFFRKFLLAAFVTVFFLPMNIAHGQDVKIVSMEKYVSTCLYNFSRYINWPADKRSGDFVITIVGSKQVYNEMSKLTQGLKVGMQPIQVKLVNSVRDLTGYQQMVYLAEWQSGKLKELLPKINGSSTLVVTQGENLISEGSMINFVPVNGLMQFEMSPNNLHKYNLVASSTLERLSKVIN